VTPSSKSQFSCPNEGYGKGFADKNQGGTNRCNKPASVLELAMIDANQSHGRSTTQLAQPSAIKPGTRGEQAFAAPEKIEAVCDVLKQLGEQTSAQRVAQALHSQTGLALDEGEVALIISKLREWSTIPPPVDQPPPENARQRSS